MGQKVKCDLCNQVSEKKMFSGFMFYYECPTCGNLCENCAKRNGFMSYTCSNCGSKVKKVELKGGIL